MSIVCSDGKTIAADGLTTFGDEWAMRPSVKIKVVNGCIYAYAGILAMRDVITEWYSARVDYGNPPKSPEKDAWTLLVIDQTETHYHVDSNTPWPIVVDVPYAMGSGDRYALGALHAGATPREAVEIACKLSISCGPPIQELNIAEALADAALRKADAMIRASAK